MIQEERAKEEEVIEGGFPLNIAQKEAVLTFDTPLLVLAGAGSGKTRVITAKIAEIIASGRAQAFQILAVTFTNKAANEMVERVKGLTSYASELNIGTFHSICVKMLRRHAALIGFKTNFLIADAADQKNIVKGIMQEMGIDIKTFNPNTILAFISRVKEQFISPQQLEASFGNFPGIYREVKLHQIYQIYQARLAFQNMMDFDDLLFFTTRLLVENQDILEGYRELFKYILIDEYQDINSLQYKWFKLLAEGNSNVCVVGDDDQSIYGWRGADVGIILSFAKDFKNAKVIKLEQNYRSTGNIIKAAEAIILNNVKRLGKNLFTKADDGEKVKITCYADSKVEAKDIVSRIETYKKVNGKNYSDFAILVRSSNQTRILEEAFIALGLPYKIVGGLKFYERREIKDILSYIKIINGNEDDIAMERVLKVPKKGIGETSIDKLIDYARGHNLSLLALCFQIAFDEEFCEKIVGVKALSILRNFMFLIQKWKQMIKEGDIKSFIQTVVYVIEDIKYIEFLKEEDEDQIEARKANINELLNSMQSFASVDAFLEHISLLASVDDISGAEEDAVKMLTMHTSKGLEFPIVFLPGWEDGLFPSAKALDEGEMRVEEERRLAYVGITRAREDLFISYTKMRMIYGGFNPTRESIFVSELKGTKCVDFRDKTIGMSSTTFGIGYGRNYENSGDRFRAGSFSDEIKSAKSSGRKVDIIDKGSIVKHKIFGTGVVSMRISSNLFEITFESGEVKTIRGDFLTFVKKGDE